MQDISEPIIKPVSKQTFSILEKEIPETKVLVEVCMHA
jgi:hypothetical protein